MDILHIFSDFINRYFSNETDGIKAGYLTATGILTNLIPEHIEEEERQTIDVTEEQFNDLRKIATTSYCFDVFGILKSRFIEGGADGPRTQNTIYRFTKTLLVCGMTQ